MTEIDPQKAEPKVSIFEQHAQTTVVAVMLAVLLGSGGLLMAMREDVQGLKKDVSYLTEAARDNLNDRFRKSDWAREEKALEERFGRIERRLDRHEEDDIREHRQPRTRTQ